MRSLEAWSWKEIINLYKLYGEMLIEFERLEKSINPPKPHILFDDELNAFLMKFWGDVNQINRNVEALDREIARRNKLIGVI